ncbi:DUF3631 domain-containing protein [Amycolatopsis sp. NPDC005003]
MCWCEQRGGSTQVMKARLAKELDRYLIRPKDLKVSGKTLKGYRIDGDGGLADAWSRYLPPGAPGRVGPGLPAGRRRG